MFAYRNTRAKYLTGIAVSCLVLAVALSHAPAAAGTSAAEHEQSMTVDINVPLNEIKDGQFCQAYALVWNGTSPYTFTWHGQFDNSDGQYGPLGEDQIVNGYIAGWRGDSLKLVVEDESDPVQKDSVTVFLNIGSEFNDDCEA